VHERLRLDRPLLLHSVQVDPLTELVPHGDRVGGETGETDVGLFGGGEDLWEGEGQGRFGTERVRKLLETPPRRLRDPLLAAVTMGNPLAVLWFFEDIPPLSGEVD
jgi:hypothetical protein